MKMTANVILDILLWAAVCIVWFLNWKDVNDKKIANEDWMKNFNEATQEFYIKIGMLSYMDKNEPEKKAVKRGDPMYPFALFAAKHSKFFKKMIYGCYNMGMFVVFVPLDPQAPKEGEKAPTREELSKELKPLVVNDEQFGDQNWGLELHKTEDSKDAEHRWTRPSVHLCWKD